MEIISIPQLKLSQLQHLAEDSLRITASIALLSDQRGQVKSAFDVFVAGMKKDNATSNRKTLDRTRDQLVSGFFFAIKAEEYHPYTDAGVIGKIDTLRKIAEEYGFKINKLPYDEETVAIDNMIARVEALKLTEMKHLSRWIPLIREANQNFKSASGDYFDQRMKAAATESATEAAPELLVALENLYTMLFAHATVKADELLIKAYQQLSALVHEYK